MIKKYDICHVSRLRMGTDGDGIRALVLTSGCLLKCKYCINPFTWNGTESPKKLTAEEIYDMLDIDRLYILATNGGITIGGGEPLLQPELFHELRMIIDPNMTLYAETSFQVPYENIQSVENIVDKFFVDIKTTDSSIYKKYTSGELDIALKNLERFILDYGPKKLVLRIPIIPGFTTRDDQIKSKVLLEKIGVKSFDLFEYNA